MYEILLGLFLLVAILLITIILLQQGKGADMGASFGAGASNTVFGASGSGNFMTRSTAILAILFFVIALALGYLSSHRDKSATAADDLLAPVETTPVEAAVTPAADASVPAADVPAADVPASAPAASDVPAVEPAPAATPEGETPKQ